MVKIKPVDIDMPMLEKVYGKCEIIIDSDGYVTKVKYLDLGKELNLDNSVKVAM